MRKLEEELNQKLFHKTQADTDYRALQDKFNKLTREQYDLVNQNKNLARQNEATEAEMMQRLSSMQEDTKKKEEKIEALKNIVNSFQEEINNFEQYQDAATRDIDKLKMKSEMYKKLYEQERAEKQLKTA